MDHIDPEHDDIDDPEPEVRMLGMDRLIPPEELWELGYKTVEHQEAAQRLLEEHGFELRGDD